MDTTVFSIWGGLRLAHGDMNNVLQFGSENALHKPATSVVADLYFTQAHLSKKIKAQVSTLTASWPPKFWAAAANRLAPPAPCAAKAAMASPASPASPTSATSLVASPASVTMKKKAAVRVDFAVVR